jgi:IS30 family transposase
MLKVGRPGLTDGQMADMWRQWKAGYSIREISEVLHRAPSAVGVQLAERGGIAPPIRRRAAIALTMAEREEISRGLSCGRSLRSIAKQLGRAASTVSREVARHGGRHGYRANHADYEAWACALRPKLCLLARNQRLRKLVACKLNLEPSRDLLR